MKKHWVIIFVFLVSISSVSYGLGLVSGIREGLRKAPKAVPIQVMVNEGTGKPAEFDLSTMWEAYRTLKERFVDQSKIEPNKMLQGAITGFVSSIGDPYTVYVEPQDQQKFVEDPSGSFGGIGAEIGIRKDVLVIIAPLEGSPAERAGLKAGDRIFKIDDVFSADLTLDEAIQHIRGPIGTVVKLIILSENAEETKDVSITRETIIVPSIKWEVRNGIGILRLLNFNADAGRAFAGKLADMRKLSQKKLVIDLRNNPGGYLDIAEEIASYFLPRGEVVVYEVDAAGTKTAFYSRGYGILEGYTVVVLINQGSASASEILAGALRDSKGVKLVGEKSYGKGSVQELIDLTDGSMMKVTTAKWLTPSGVSINDNGLKPDYEIKLEDEGQTDDKKDIQLEKAIEFLTAPPSTVGSPVASPRP